VSLALLHRFLAAFDELDDDDDDDLIVSFVVVTNKTIHIYITPSCMDFSFLSCC
jgi:hypothetical protein